MVAATKKTGYLYKQSEYLKSWNVRWFSLEDLILFYFKAQNQSNARGSLYLPGCIIKKTGPRTCASGTFHTFTIEHPASKKHFRLSADTEHTCDEWIRLLRDAASSDAGKSTTDSPAPSPAKTAATAKEHTPVAEVKPSPAKDSAVAKPASVKDSADTKPAVAKDSSAPEKTSATPAATKTETLASAGNKESTPPSADTKAANTYAPLEPSMQKARARVASAQDHPFVQDMLKAADMVVSAAKVGFQYKDTDGWHFVKEEGGAGENAVRIYSQDSKGSTNCVMGIGVVRGCAARDLWEYVISLESRHEWDSMFNSGKVLVRLSGSSEIVSMRFEGVFPTKARDLCFVSNFYYDEEHDFYVTAGRSIDYEACPDHPQYVRAFLHAGGFVIKQRKGENNVCDVAYMVNTDLKGSIPTMVMNMVALKQPMIVAAVARVVRQRGIPSASSQPSTAQDDESDCTATRQTNGKGDSDVTRKDDAAGAGAVSRTTSAVEEVQVRKSPTGPTFKVNWPFVVPLALVMYAMWDTIGASFATACQLAMAYFIIEAVLELSFYIPGMRGMSTRRKLMMCTWEEPKEGVINGTMRVDARNLLAYIQRVRKETGVKVTVTHFVIKALGLAMAKYPATNGRLALGRFVPHSSVDVSCLVALENGKDLANAKITDADKIPLTGVANLLAKQADKLRKGRDKDFEASKPILQALPVFMLRPIINLCGFLAGALGIEIDALGVRPFPFGSVMVTSVGSLGIDEGFAPFTPFAHVPMLILVGAVKENAVVVNGNVAAQPQLILTCTIDHRLMDGTQGAMMVQELRRYIDNPDLLDNIEHERV